jgi:hypothetical protein
MYEMIMTSALDANACLTPRGVTDSGQLGPELLEDKLISFGSVIVIKNEWVTKVNSVRSKVRDRKDILDCLFAMVVHTFTEHDG